MPRPKGSGNKNRSELVQLALTGLDVQIQQIQAQLDALTAKRREISRSGAVKETVSSASVASKKQTAGVTSPKKRKKRKVSEETRQKLSEAAQARWARQRGEA
jgi:hypothetical protein